MATLDTMDTMDTMEMIPPRRPPMATEGVLFWLRNNLFNSIPNTVVTIIMVYLLARVFSATIQWVVTTPGWVAVPVNTRLLMVGPYTPELVWRTQLAVWIIALLLGLSAGIHKGILRAIAIGFGVVMLLGVPYSFLLPTAEEPTGNPISPLVFLLGTVAVMAAGHYLGERYPERLKLPVNIAWLLSYPFIMIVVIRGFGDSGPFRAVPTNLWGGLLVTVALSAIGIIVSFPIGILLALGRRSELPVVKGFCTIYIETIRAVPLITILYMGSLILPLFLPRGIEPPTGLVRAMVAVTLFSAAYLAESVRGGLQAIPKGQFEAAHVLGLSYWQTSMLITLPQALRTTIPVLVGQAISLFKDTSLVTIVGLFDLLGIAQQMSRQTEWLEIPGGVFREALVTISIIYFIVSFAMSRVSLNIEKNLGLGK